MFNQTKQNYLSNDKNQYIPSDSSNVKSHIKKKRHSLYSVINKKIKPKNIYFGKKQSKENYIFDHLTSKYTSIPKLKSSNLFFSKKRISKPNDKDLNSKINFLIKQRKSVNNYIVKKKEHQMVTKEPEESFEICFSLTDFENFEKNMKNFKKDLEKVDSFYNKFNPIKKIDVFMGKYFQKIENIGKIYKNITEIGRGSYAIVYSAFKIKQKHKIVLKSIKFENFRKLLHIKRFMVKKK